MEWSLTGLPLPITLRPPSPLSDDELIAFSRKNKPYRIEKNSRGQITILTPVGTEGGKRELRVGMQFMAWADQDGTGEANGPNAGWNLPDGSTLNPDACWTSNAKTAQFSAEERERYLPICPDFIVEVRSRSDSPSLLAAKMTTWIDNGAQLAWLLDPTLRPLPSISRDASRKYSSGLTQSKQRRRWPASA
jgi:Uma2 family endonuclease